MKPSRYDSVWVTKKREKINETWNNPGGEASVPALRDRVERLEQATNNRDIPNE